MMKLVVVDANAYWTEQLFKRCNDRADILLVKALDFRAFRRANGRVFGDSSPREMVPGVWEQRLSMPPDWLFSLWPVAQRKIVRTIRQFTRDTPFILVLTYPQYRSLIQILRPARSVYYNYDDYQDNWPGQGTTIPCQEDELIRTVTDIICIADYRVRTLRSRYPQRAVRIHHIPIGCSPEFMANESQPQTPTELAGLTRPVVGYIGALNSRFDYGFFSQVAALMPDVTFALGGMPPCPDDGDEAWRDGLRRVRSLSNVTFLGWVEHSALGRFLNNFDALLMVYSRCNFNTNACPAKLWDYIGTLRPIVANTANPETLLWREVVHIGETPKAFEAALREVLRGEPASVIQRRRTIANDHTWERLSCRVKGVLDLAQGVDNHEHLFASLPHAAALCECRKDSDE